MILCKHIRYHQIKPTDSHPTFIMVVLYRTLLLLLSRLTLTLLLPTPHAPDISTSTLQSTTDVPTRALGTARSSIASALCTTGDSLSGTFRAAHGRVRNAAAVGAAVVFAAALCAVNALLAESVADGLQQATFADLAGGEVVDAVLEVVDLVDAGDFGLVEAVCPSRQLHYSADR